MISAKIGLRNLARNRWRSGLTLGGIGISVAFMVWILGFMQGWMGTMVQGATAVETVQVQVHKRSYAENPRVYRTFSVNPDLLDAVRDVEGVVAVSPRVELNGLVGHEEKSQVGRVMGVDPALEAATTPVATALIDGRWLAQDPPVYPAPREVVLGAGMASQLRVGPGDELVVFVEAADGSMGNDLLQVVGIVRTANTAVDRMTAYMHIEDARFLAAVEGEAHELAIKTDDLLGAQETAALVASALGAGLQSVPSTDSRSGGEAGSGAEAAISEPDPEGLLVRSWQEILPSIYQMLTISGQSNWFTYLLIYLVAAIGLVNTQRMSALERKREFGVLLAIGMRPRKMFRMVLTESLVLGTLGGLIGTAIGLAVTGYHATAGLDLAAFTDKGEFTVMGVAFTGKIYAILTPTAVLQPILIMILVAFLAGLWPAFKSSRLDPAPTIAGRQ
ncbi:MAG: ABC transporter permease [Gemmatimonadetes bacterium]|nr:ABC transporter permease [Gemmatimonadota bacterium]